MSVSPGIITTQPDSLTTSVTAEQPVTTQPTSASSPVQHSKSADSGVGPRRKSSSQVSYADSDEHAQRFHCAVMRCCRRCASGEDERWYYPWDKGLLCCLPLGCGWCLVGLLFPCCMCIPWCRNIICLVQEGAWDGTCFGACICGIPRDGTGRPRSNSEDSETYP